MRSTTRALHHGLLALTATLAAATTGCFLAASVIGDKVASKSANDANEADAAADNVALPKGTGPRKRIGIVLSDDGSEPRHRSSAGSLASAAGTATTEILVKSDAFVVVEREEMAKVLKEQGLGMTGAVSSQSAAAAGQLLGLQAIVTVKVMDYDEGRSTSGMIYAETKRSYTARVSLRMVDATTGEIWIAETGQGTATETSAGTSSSYDENLGKRALYRAVRSAASAVVQAANKRPWSATVAKVAQTGVYVVAGAGSGLAVGARLKVRALGDEITDPASGQIIGRELGKILGTIKVASHVNDKLTLCEVSDGQGFSAGDQVVLDGA